MIKRSHTQNSKKDTNSVFNTRSSIPVPLTTNTNMDKETNKVRNKRRNSNENEELKRGRYDEDEEASMLTDEEMESNHNKENAATTSKSNSQKRRSMNERSKTNTANRQINDTAANTHERNEKFTIRFSGNDIGAYYDETNKSVDKEGLLECLKVFRPTIGVHDIKVYKKEETMIMVVILDSEDDYHALLENEKLEVKNKKGEVYFTIGLSASNQKYVFAVKNVPISFNVTSQSKEMSKLITDWDLASLERKRSSENTPSTALIGMTTNKEKFLDLLRTGAMKIQNRNYTVEVWIFKPLQCYNCGEFEHMSITCVNPTKCLKCCVVNSHKTSECNCKGLQLKCMYCNKNHSSTSLQCDIVRGHYRKTNKTYAKLLKKNNIKDKGIERIFKSVPITTIINYESGDEGTKSEDPEIKRLFSLYNSINTKVERHESELEVLFDKANEHTKEIQIQDKLNEEQENINKVVETGLTRVDIGLRSLGVCCSEYVQATNKTLTSFMSQMKYTNLIGSLKPLSEYMKSSEDKVNEEIRKEHESSTANANHQQAQISTQHQSSQNNNNNSNKSSTQH